MIDERTRFITVGPVVPRADVLDPLRRVRETFDIFNRPAGLEQEDGGVGAVHQAAHHDAARRPCANDHVVVTAGEQAVVVDSDHPRYFLPGHPLSPFFWRRISTGSFSG